MQEYRQIIEQAWEDRAALQPGKAPAKIGAAVEFALNQLDQGALRVAEKVNDEWITHAWVKKAVLLSFRLEDNRVMESGVLRYWDNVPSKFQKYDREQFERSGIRVAPGAVVRRGACIGRNVVLMPCFVDIGARIGDGTTIDAWATVGACAQIGKNVRLSSGAGIGGVLEPLQANPTIIGDNCFIGARSEITEGVILEDDCVISMGVCIGRNTRIYNRATGAISQGRVPAGAVVVPGALPSADGQCSLYCAVIVRQVDADTRARIGIDALLRDI
ncbi:MAG: 2,3,4,5-tetrahydropyridine-2,6-dicarboxylate N-succinyltransferase [Zoogloeaceae bacterium]|jgi:2,3,4,5-tetrahydropyridine-2-carboxylate N-succinyltransferase|nr:2,3,4,5-tetrahydropyridine-2,6-dicarboxylate N-succinyltransferase [Zoogloeaceae bacterium]